MKTMRLKVYFTIITLLFIAVNSNAQTVFKYKVAIIGNPINTDIRYDDSQLKALKNLGFNTIQLNIAWGSRPADEPLNLEDILYSPGEPNEKKVEKRLNDLKFRAKQAKKYGFRTIFHFGAPRIDSLYKVITNQDQIDKATEKSSVQKPEIVARYTNFLKRLHQEVPEIDDILVYTFDQEAWQANEFGDGATDRNIPLHNRLPQFITALTTTWAKLNSNGVTWWEPWELSAGQIYACLPSLPKNNFGFSLHSNIAEVQIAHPVDVWLKNMTNILAEKNIPVITEIFMGTATEEIEPLQYLAAPRLVFEEIVAVSALKNVTGIKEYYGFVPDLYDPNLMVAGLKLADPIITLENALFQVTKPFGLGAPKMLAAWEASAKALQLFPWDCSWNIRRLTTKGYVYHDWKRAIISGDVAISPSWVSTRQAFFMTTEDRPQNPWFYEDVELRCKASADSLLSAIMLCKQAKALTTNGTMQTYLDNEIKNLQQYEQSVRALQYYCKAINLAFLMRKYAAINQAIPPTLINQFKQLINSAIKNQEKGFVEKGNAIGADKILVEFNAGPAKWVMTNLLMR
jgi:hypothetical protein